MDTWGHLHQQAVLEKKEYGFNEVLDYHPLDSYSYGQDKIQLKSD